MTELSCRDKRPIHVLFVNTRNELGADLAVHLLLARELVRQGHRVSFTVNRAARQADAIEARLLDMSGVHILSYDFGSPLAARNVLGRVTSAVTSLSLFGNAGALAAYVHRHHIDVLHATDRPRDALLCTLLGSLTNRASLIHMHSNYYPGFSRVSRFAFAHSDVVVGVSDYTCATVAVGGLAPQKLAVIHNAVDAAHFGLANVPHGKARAQWGIPADAPLLGLIGRFIRFKGHLDLLEALRRSDRDDVHALFAGDDANGDQTYVLELHQRIHELGLDARVHFTGFQEDVRPILADLDALVVPSWEEPFGLVVIEAMAMQVPVIAYRAGGIPEIITDEQDGLLVSPRDIAALGHTIQRLLANPELQVRLGLAGRQTVVTRFSPAHQACAMVALYQRLTHIERGVDYALASSR